MAQQVKVISEDTYKWDILSLLSLIPVVFGIIIFSENHRTWLIAFPLIIFGCILSVVFKLGPKLKKEGKFSLSFANSIFAKLFQKLVVVKVPLSVDGAILEYKKKKSIIRRLKGHPSGMETWRRLLEVSSFFNTEGIITFMELNTRQAAVLRHKKINKTRKLTLKDPKKRRKMDKYLDGVSELEKVLGTTGIIIETYEGPIPENSRSQYGNIESEEVDAKAFLNILRGMPVILNTLAAKATSSVSNAISVVFEFIGGREPSVGNRYFKFIRVTDFDPTKGYKQLIDICRRNFAEPIISLKPMTPTEALSLLEKQRDKRNIKQEQANNGTGGKNEQILDNEDERLKKIKEFEARIRRGENTYKVFLKIRCGNNNTADLSKTAEQILQDLEIAGYEAVIPEDQDSMLMEMVTIDPGDNSFGFYMLANDIASVLTPLVKKSQMFAEPEGFAFGIAEYGDRVMKNIVKLLSGGIGLIVGLTGSGKSYLMAGMAYFMSFIGYRIVIFDPKGKGLANVSFSRLLSKVEGAVAIACESLNIFDMFEDIETQKTYQRGAVSILFKDISDDLIDIICQKANDIREKGIIPTFEILKKSFKEEENRLGEKQQTTDFIQSIKQESVTLKNLRKVISFIDPLVSKERAKYFKATPVGLKYPSDPEVAANGFIGIDFSPISEEFIKRVIMNLVLFQMQIQMLQKMKVRTMLFVDEMHDVIAASNHGGPDSESILKKISDEGRSNGMILIGAAQILSKLLESIAGKHLADNASWIVQMGRPEFDEANRQGESAVNALRNLGATEDDIKYLKALTENEIGQGLLIVKGQSPLQFKVDFASYIHRWITGEEKTIESDRVLGPVLRFAKFEKKYHRSLMNTMGYRSIRHKDLNNVSTDFLFRKTEDPELAIDLFLIEEYFKKQGIEVIPDYESGLISVNNGETLIYIQPYNGNTFTPEELVSQLDEEPDHNQWFIIYHDDEYKSIMTEALKSNIILREDIPMNVEKIIKTNS